jgi:hypothetical protein
MAKSSLLEVDGDLVILKLTINRARPLGMQLVPLRALDIPWKLLIEMTGRSRSTLQEQHQKALDRLGASQAREG